MTERFYLLRNNRETGPYSLDELLQQCLLPGDLLWVEGRSQNWAAPFEIDEVQRALPKGYSLSPSAADAGGLQHPSDLEQSQRAEQLRRRALAALYQQQTPAFTDAPKPMHTAPAYYGPEDEAVQVVQHKAGRSGVAGEFFLFCTLAAFGVLGWRSGFFAQVVRVPHPEVVVASKLSTESSHAANGLNLASVQTPVSIPAQQTAVAAQTDSSAWRDSMSRVAAIPKKTWKRVPAVTATNAETTAVQPPMLPKENTAVASNPAHAPAPKDPDAGTEAGIPKKPQKETADADTKSSVKTAATTETVAADDAGKHKSFGQVLRGIFRKKKKDDAATTSVQAPAPGR